MVIISEGSMPLVPNPITGHGPVPLPSTVHPQKLFL